MAVLVVKDSFYGPNSGRSYLKVTQEEVTQTCIHLGRITIYLQSPAQGYNHSPTIIDNALAEILQQLQIQEGVQIYQYTDDVLVGGKEKSAVRSTAQDIWNRLNEERVEVPSTNCQGPSKEVKFLRTWCVAGQAVIPDEIITKLDAISTPLLKRNFKISWVLWDTGEIMFLDFL